MDEKCMNCKYYKDLQIFTRKVKELGSHNVITGFGIGKNKNKYELSHCCTAFLEIDGANYIVETVKDDKCELFKNKNDFDCTKCIHCKKSSISDSENYYICSIRYCEIDHIIPEIKENCGCKIIRREYESN